jgi:hypothetical protein
MSRRSSLVLVALVACGGAEHEDPTTPAPAADVATCPSAAVPERCRELAQAAANSNNNSLAWAYTVLECQSPTGSECATMWQSYARLAPTQTDALNVLHTACAHNPSACAQLATWHTQRGHSQAAAIYDKRATAAAQDPHAALSLATDLAALVHISDAPPRTDSIAQNVGRQLRPITHAVATTKSRPKAWAMRAATEGGSSDGCATTAMLDRHPTPLAGCVAEVRPFEADQIAVRNRCGQALTVAYAGARADGSTFVKQVRLEPYEALSAGISHREIGPLTFGVCGGECRVTSSPDDVSASWSGQDGMYFCAKGSH